MKKVFAVLLAAFLALSVWQTAFAAQETVVASGTAGEGVTWALTADGTLTVSGSGPIVDETEVEIDEDGMESVTKLDCISWQLEDALAEKTETLSFAEAERLRFAFVKALVVEEGITEIPDDEFDNFYPRSIVLPSTLKSLGSAAIDAEFAESLTVNSRELVINGGVSVSCYSEDAAPFETMEEAISAKIKAEADAIALDETMASVYDLGTVLEIQNGLFEMTPEEFLSDYNERHGTALETLDACAAHCVEEINAVFSTDYATPDEIYAVITEDGYSYLQRDAELDGQMDEMRHAVEIDDRLTSTTIGDETALKPYQWLTVHAPAGSETEQSVKDFGLPFGATAPAQEDISFFGKIKRFFEQIADWIKSLILYVSALIRSK